MQRQRQSPPKHRHDGTSPLPLGMDWSPPPKLWAGRETVWPHDPHTGWSYCVTIPSWVVLAKSTNSDPVVAFCVHNFPCLHLRLCDITLQLSEVEQM